jgi:hypothetical protein
MDVVEAKLEDVQLPVPDTSFSHLPSVPEREGWDKRTKPYRHLNKLEEISNKIKASDLSLSNFGSLPPLDQRATLLRGEEDLEDVMRSLKKLTINAHGDNSTASGDDADDGDHDKNVHTRSDTVEEKKEEVENMRRNLALKLGLLRTNLKQEDYPVVVDACESILPGTTGVLTQNLFQRSLRIQRYRTSEPSHCSPRCNCTSGA